jgi:HK97 family phage portal protein
MHIAALSRAAQVRALTLSGVGYGTGYGGFADGGRGWIRILDRPSGAFQQNLRIDPMRVESNWAVFACQTLIAGDMGKLCVRILDKDADGINIPVEVPAFSPVLRKPNNFQTWQKFIERWMLSKLSHGNAYILKERDNRKVVVGLVVLDPHRVTPLVSPSGDVYYQLGQDWLNQVPEGTITVPASEIIHDRMWCLYHPLVGLSPIFANGLAAIQGLEIQGNQAHFFANNSRPSGILIAPGKISDDNAKNLKTRWETFRGSDVGGVAVLGDGLQYQPLTQNAVDSQLVQQLDMSAKMICTTYHVPGYKVGVGETPKYDNAETLNQIYYEDCLQTLIEGVESLLDDGLGLPDVVGHQYCAKFDIDGLLRMDAATQVETLKEEVGAGYMKPNEARAKRNMKPVTGGDTPYMQQQNYPLAALADPTRPPPAGHTPPTPGQPDAPAKAISSDVDMLQLRQLVLED